MKLAGKKALITGGNSGIGLATARLFIAEGAQVAITGRDQKTLDEAIAELGSSARGYRADITVAEDRKQLFDETKAAYDQQMDPRYGAARLWIDKIIDPMETREAIITALDAASLNPEVPKFSVGVLQT